MDDGLGFTIGSLFGGFLYQSVGGSMSFKVFSSIALLTCFANIIFRRPHKNISNGIAMIEKTEKLPEEAKKLNDDTIISTND